MDIKTLTRMLQIGFMDSLSLQKRTQLINSDYSLSDILKLYPKERDRTEEVNSCINWVDSSSDHSIWWCTEKDYPIFGCIERALPYMLFIKGQRPNNLLNAVSIVGTRHCDNTGFQMAFKLGLEASVNDIPVVSGIADGCDQAALCGALEGNSPCYSILGNGLEVDYPVLSNTLKKRILNKGGALISRFAPLTLPYKYNFPNRNLIIAAMGNAIIIVQAPMRSGALITADFGLQMGKDIFVSKSGCGYQWSRKGSDRLAYDGAKVIYSIDGITMIKTMAFECDYPTEKSVRFGNRLYILKQIRK